MGTGTQLKRPNFSTEEYVTFTEAVWWVCDIPKVLMVYSVLTVNTGPLDQDQ